MNNGEGLRKPATLVEQVIGYGRWLHCDIRLQMGDPPKHIIVRSEDNKARDSKLAGYIFTPSAAGVGGPNEAFKGVLIEEYAAEALHSDDFSFGRQQLLRKGYMVVGDERSNIAHDVVGFLLGRQSGDAEDSLHARDDCLFHIMGDISGMPLQRNKVSDGSTKGARLDMDVGQPPCVVAEEKDKRSKLGDAVRECLTKTAWIPHYALLPFLVGVAVAGDLVQFFTFNAQGKKTQVHYRLTSVVDRAKYVVAAINTGCYLKYIEKKKLVPAVGFTFNRPSKDSEGRRQLIISWKQVDKTYYHMDAAERTRLKSFYEQCSKVPCLERAQIVDEEDGRLRLLLTPVGLQRLPCSTDEAKVAIKCIFMCLKGCHELGWVLCDVRWPNIILLGDHTWCIIDAEMVRKMGERLPAMKVAMPAREPVASASTDLYMVYKLLSELAGTMELDSDLQQLCELLRERKTRQRATADALLKKPWLQAVSTPSSSPQASLQPSAKSGERSIEQQAAQHRQPTAPAGMQDTGSSRALRAMKRVTTQGQPGEDKKKSVGKKRKRKSQVT
ncbi:g10223 [Coccomyxa elongata]